MPESQDRQAAPIQRDALGRWPPGVSGNPGGSPEKKVKLTSLLRRILAERANPKDPNDPTTKGDLLMQAAVMHAREGNAAFFKELLDRIDGKQAERIEADLGPDWEYVLPSEDEDDGTDDGEAQQ